ncbi:MAG TPA: HlyD family efflux transporter periplasmic adaptor subunit, partial [Candidatus Competibacteraceae bacterium]|nr:HlyD family efflux transporter periplasmic adaptor subunit [Candidatus Competibacteraceae bacterium]
MPPTPPLHVAVLSLTLLLLAGCGKSAPPIYQGYVEGEYLQMMAPVAGRLEALAVSRGDTVAAGAALFRLEPEPERQALDEARERLAAAQARLADLGKGQREEELQVIRAQLEQARAQLALSEKQFIRQRELHARNLSSPAALDESRSQRDRDAARVEELEARLRTGELAGRSDAIRAAEAEVKAAAATVEQASWRLAQKAVSAPRAGLVADTLYRVGEWVAAGAPVVSLLPPENRKLRFFVPETVVGGLRPGMA